MTTEVAKSACHIFFQLLNFEFKRDELIVCLAPFLNKNAS